MQRRRPSGNGISSPGMIAAARAQTQHEGLLWTGGIVLLFGLLVSPIFARLLPLGIDGRVAAYILQADRWGAGAALMQTANPQAWRGMMDEHNLAQLNGEAIAACRAVAGQTKKEQRCTAGISTTLVKSASGTTGMP